MLSNHISSNRHFKNHKFFRAFVTSIFTFFSFLLLFSCDEKDKNLPDISRVPEVEIEVIRMEKELIAPKDKQTIALFLNNHPGIAEKYFRRRTFPSDSILINNIYSFATDSHTDTLLTDTKRIYGDFETISQELEQAFRFLRYYYPNFIPPKVYTNISGFGAFGFGQDIFLTEEFIVIGLDYFAGTTATYLPPETPGYI
ncbi:MAG: hypothetical protein AAGI07_16745, partial [Bacteroidota bacterium]